MSFITKFEDAFKAIGHKISAGFVALFGSDTSKEFAAAAEKMLATEAGKIALTVVEQIQGSMPNASITEKIDAFYKNVAPAVKAAGLEASDWTLGVLRELGVGKFKGVLDKLNALSK
jgi:hypothetical protein